MIPRLTSVIIPTRDRAGLLSRAISSLQAQTYPDLEIIVVDDGSKDTTPSVIGTAQRTDPRVRGVRHDLPLGPAAARNTGAALARGEYLLFEDDDCRGQPDRLALLVAALEASPAATYAYCWMLSHDTDGSTTLHADQGPWSIGTPYALIRAEAFRTAGGFDSLLPRLEDFDLWTRLLARAPAVAVPRMLFETVRDDTGISASSDRFVAASQRILEKYRDSDLPSAHLAAMHRRLGGKLMVNGFREAGLAHLRRSVRVRKRSVRSWLGLAAGAAGPAAYRAVARVKDRLVRTRKSRAAP